MICVYLLHKSGTCQLSSQLATSSIPSLRKYNRKIQKCAYPVQAQTKSTKPVCDKLTIHECCEQDVRPLLLVSVPGHWQVPAPSSKHSFSCFYSTCCSNYPRYEAPTLWVGGLQCWEEKVVHIRKVSMFPMNPSCEQNCTI